MKYQKDPSFLGASSAVSFATYFRAPLKYPALYLSSHLDAGAVVARFRPWFEWVEGAGAAAKPALVPACSFVAPDYIEVGAKTMH